METNKSKDFDDSVLSQIRQIEKTFFHGALKWISIIIGALYGLGYIWKTSYYKNLGIPHSLIDYPFPEILIPNSWTIIIFICSLITIYVTSKYYDYFADTRRQMVDNIFRKTTKITCPIKDVVTYMGKQSNKDKSKNNGEMLVSIINNYYAGKINKSGKASHDDFEVLLNILKDNIHDESESLKESVIYYILYLYILENKEREIFNNSAVIAAGGAFPKGINVSKYIIYITLILYFVFSISFHYYWQMFNLLSGAALGLAVYKLSDIENRTQFWRLIIFVVIMVCWLQYYDAFLAAKRDLKTVNFPLIKNVELNNDRIDKSFTDVNETNPGVLLGSFHDKYFILSSNKSLEPSLHILDFDQVSDIEISYMRWVQISIKRSRNKLNSILENLLNLEEKGMSLINDLKGSNNVDPNTLNDINDIEVQIKQMRKTREDIKKRIEDIN